MSIRPCFADRILDGSKRVEFRTRFGPAAPVGVLVYATAPACRLVGTFSVAAVERGTPSALWRRHAHQAGVNLDEYREYFAGRDREGVALVVADPSRLRRPLPLSAIGLDRPPQSYRYLPDASVNMLPVATRQALGVNSAKPKARPS